MTRDKVLKAIAIHDYNAGGVIGDRDSADGEDEKSDDGKHNSDKNSGLKSLFPANAKGDMESMQ